MYLVSNLPPCSECIVDGRDISYYLVCVKAVCWILKSGISIVRRGVYKITRRLFAKQINPGGLGAVSTVEGG